MNLLIKRFRVPEEDESAVLTEAVLKAEYHAVPGKRKEQSLGDFLTNSDVLGSS